MDDANRPPSTDLMEAWNTQLEPGITQVLRGEEPLTFEAHAAMYTLVYNLCMKTNSYNCRDLHSHVSQFYAAYTSRILTDAPDDDKLLLEYYDTEWSRFSHAAQIVDRIFMFLNRQFVSRERQEGKKNIKTVRNVAFTFWKTNVLDPLAPRLETGADAAHFSAVRTMLASEDWSAANVKNMAVRAV
ncbi:Cullin repeat-like-containing domain protein [Mycena latifolia]|nr:Cullin repeat-like-containing domain protein [Mycena latifolia]